MLTPRSYLFILLLFQFCSGCPASWFSGFCNILSPFAKFSIKPKIDEKNPFLSSNPRLPNFPLEKNTHGLGLCV